MQAIIATVVFLIMDALWLGVIARKLYVENIGKFLSLSADGRMQPVWWAGAVVYVALIGGILMFVLPKANGSVMAALLWGAAFGFVTYATYDFTNLAVLSDWSLKVSIIDTIWGMVLCGVTSAVTVWLSGLFS